MYRRSLLRLAVAPLRTPIRAGPFIGRRLLPRASLLLRRHFVSDVEGLKQETDSIDVDTSPETTGVVDYEKKTETLLYFDQIYPLPKSEFSVRQYFKFASMFQGRKSPEDMKEKVTSLINSKENPLPEEVNIDKFVPLVRDGGAFVTFSLPGSLTSKELFNKITSNLEANKVLQEKNLFSYLSNLLTNSFPAAYQVKGTPWIEDLQRFPSSRLSVIFEGEALTEEELYLLFRRYGLIVDIIPASSSSPTATIVFRHIRSAISAKNCITGMNCNLSKTTLHLRYIKTKRVNHLTEFIVNHQKITIPILLAILATVAVLIFDPIRQWFIAEKIGRKYSFDTIKENQYVRFVYSPFKMVIGWFYAGYDFIDDTINAKCEEYAQKDGVVSEPEKLDILWHERFDRVKQLKLWIYENINTFIIVKGPKGSGKQEFVLEHALKADDHLSKKVLFLDCDNLVKSRTDNALIQNTAAQLGYFPVFTWTNSFSQFVDLAVQGLTGQKSGLSESKETQLKNMFLLASQSLRSVALSDYAAYKKELSRKSRHAKKDESESEESVITNSTNEFVKEDEYLQQHPEEKPIVVIDKYMLKSDGNHDFVYKMIADWTSQLIQSNLAHVIYITSDVGSLQHLTDALPNQVFKTITLSDATSESAKHFVLNQIGSDEQAKQIEDCLKPLGGRMLDLQAFSRRIKSGETATDALQEMIYQAAEQVTTFFLSNNNGANNWSTAQIWAIMRLLSKKDVIDFEELSKSPLFKSSPETLNTLSTLEKNDLISLKRDKGVLETITTGRPLYRAAFENLVKDPKIFKHFETDYFENLISLETKKIAKLEEELGKISVLSDVSLIKDRLSYITDKINGSSKKITDYEAKIKEISKIGKPDSKGFLGIF